MGHERLEFGARVRKLMVMSVKTCYRSVWNHPFLVGLVCFLIFLYRTFPLLFSVLVTASPVLVCTAVLLGTLLSFGSPNIPEIDEREEEKVSHEVSSLKTRVTADDTVVERDVGDDDFVVERHVGKRWDKLESADEKVSLVNNEVSDVEEDDGSVRYKPLIGEDLDSRDIHCENGVIDGVEETVNDSLVEKKREIQEEMLGSEGVLRMRDGAEDHLLADELRDRTLEEAAKLTADFNDVQKGDELDASLLSSWKRVGDEDDEDDGDGDDDDDESLDSGSDGAESSSPDASMADIIPMLDELHPLLGAEAPQPAQMSHDDSDAASDRSHGSSNDESDESDELENHVEEDNDEEEDEEEGAGAKEDKEDESKSAIKWTETDEKNLMDLGSSELERNQRLENLIARRRARKNMRLMAEKNLIDLDSADLPFNVPSISTTRRNPFDLPYDSYDDLGLPPIPGSAPSILQPRRNPFDLPYDSSEEKPDLKGDSFEEEFSGFNQRETVSQREAFFRRHESFNVGPSSLGVPRQELKWKPYFVPERLLSEGASPSFQRQSSEVSESKLSSVPDTESVSSIVDDEDNKPNELDVSQETELMLHEDHASVHDEQESQSSGDVESVDVDRAEIRDVHHDVVEITLGAGESELEMESSLSGAGVTSNPEINANEVHPTTEPVEDDYSSRSSLSSLSEIDEKISDVKGEGSAAFEPTDHDPKELDISTQPSSEDSEVPDTKGEESAAFEPTDHDSKEAGISTQPSFEESEFHSTSKLVDDSQHREPVYDTSPTSVHKIISFSSIPSDTQAEISETGSLSMLVESSDKETKDHGETTEQGTSTFPEMNAGSTNPHNENEPREIDLPENSEDVGHAGSLGVSSTSVDRNVSMVSEAGAEAEHVSRDAGSSSSDDGMVDDVPGKVESSNQNEADLSSLAAETTIVVDQGMSEVLGSSSVEQQHPVCLNESSDAEPVSRLAVDKEETQLEQDEIHSSSSLEDNLVDGMDVPKEEIIQTECDQMHPSSCDASLDVSGHHDTDEKLSSTALSHQLMSSNDASSLTEESGDAVVAQISQFHPSEADAKQEDKMESEMDRVQSSCSDSKIDTGLDRDMHLEEIHSDSSHQDVSSREISLPELEKQFSASNESLDKSPIDDHDKIREPSIIATEPTVEVNIVDNDVNVHKLHDSEDKLSTDFSSMASESTSLPAESSEHTLPTDQDDLKYKILNRIDSEDPKEVSEHFNYAAEVYVSRADAENISEEVDGIKEIDEGILSELDSVGDFNVKEFGLPEGSHTGYTESSMLAEDSNTDITVELPVLEARSAEDIDLAFKQLHEGVEVEEVILPSMIENQRDPAHTNSNLPVLEARSLEDIQNALQRVPESNPVELSHSLDSGNGSSEVEGHDAVSAKEVEVGNVVPDTQGISENAVSEPKNEDEKSSKSVSGVQEISENAGGEPRNDYEEASEKASLSTSDHKGKKAKSHDSSSSSSSSSSDSE